MNLEIGSAGWMDLTIPDADRVRDFYSAVVGWKVKPIEMGGYQDYVMSTPNGDVGTAGVCHARGSNADFPPVWMVYFTVANVAESVATCRANGGEVIVEPRQAGNGMVAVIRDPAGAICGLYSVTA